MPGAKIHVSLRASGEKLEGVPDSPLVAYVRFSSLTDQQVTKQFLVGGEGKAGPTGPFDWQTIGGDLTAPPGAYRFSLFFGVKPCTGSVRFAEIRINTEPGPEPAETQIPAEARFEPVSLKAFFNHDLDGDVTKGPGATEDAGWPPAIDMSRWPRGQQVYLGVPFDLDRAIALRGSMRASNRKLPREVRNIPVGRPVAGLYFLHAARLAMNGREQFRYLLHLADGSTVALPIMAGHDIWYWSDPAPGLRPWQQENNCRTDLATGLAGVDLELLYRMEWVNPRPEIAVESIDLVGADTGEAALLAITAAVAPK